MQFTSVAEGRFKDKNKPRNPVFLGFTQRAKEKRLGLRISSFYPLLRKMKKTRKIVFVAGARPNFPKIAPLLREMKAYPNLRGILVHTGQHYDALMSKHQFRDLGIPTPKENLEVGSGLHGKQTALVLERMEELLIRRKPDLVVVVGDVNSTIAAALAAKKLHIPVAHVEAGLRSRDWSMPEEINRIATDSISDFLFTHCQEANQNLLNEGVSKRRIAYVGNVMIDTLFHMLPKAKKYSPLSSEPYGLITLHRPSNVDEEEVLRRLFRTFEKISEDLPLFFPMHPRTAKQFKEKKLLPKKGRIHLMEPLTYLPFLAAMSDAEMVLTDSGGIQEETTALGVPCLTLRNNSERMVTVYEGTNQLVGVDPKKILKGFDKAKRMKKQRKKKPKYWDGKASQRILRVMDQALA